MSGHGFSNLMKNKQIMPITNLRKAKKAFHLKVLGYDPFFYVYNVELILQPIILIK